MFVVISILQQKIYKKITIKNNIQICFIGIVLKAIVAKSLNNVFEHRRNFNCIMINCRKCLSLLTIYLLHKLYIYMLEVY